MMKKIAIIVCLMISFSLTAQEKTKRKSVAGIKGGYNLSAVSFDGKSKTDVIHGFHVGFYGESFVNEHLSIQPEILYSKQGYKIIDNGSIYTQKLDYINIPVSLKIYPIPEFFLEAGPQIGFSIAHEETFESGFTLYNTSKEFEPKNFDWGVNLGAGFKSSSGVSIGARYHFGMNDIYDEDKPKNRVLQFYIGFDF